ncbi:tetratricopeptide repeat protein [Azospirillum canadense]|uniref:tetratricopeptide repeat protein n=1 Tax=Azospirillum canadense TaxID=403962 RepID=UPI0022279787|nr:tetratricopeptide repeat protein [Azospirillum canadense]MCW2239740.1 Tfp pilus assembly protein PilF [Azospirillum canadense]
MTTPTCAAEPDARLLERIDAVVARLNRARLLGAQGRLAEAAQELAALVTQHPQLAEAWRALALLLRSLRHPEAEGCLRRALQDTPADATLAAELGLLLLEAGRVAEAGAAMATALEAGAEGSILRLILGTALAGQRQHGQAADQFRGAVALAPGMAAAWAGLGSALEALDRLDAAAAALRRALRLNPQDAAVRTALGAILRTLGRDGDAELELRHALALATNQAAAYANLGALLLHRKDDAAAELSLDRALALDPALAEAQLNRGILHLTRGDLPAGWRSYGWRFAARRNAVPHDDLPLWAGEPLAGRCIVVTAEQGVGDELMFASALPDLIAMAGRVIVECDARLVSLFTRSFPQATVRPRGSPAGDAELRIPAGSLPQIVRDRLSAFPTRPSWLVPDPDRVVVWGRRLAALGPGLRVGIAWRSGLMTTERRAAYTRLDQWGPLAAVPGLRLVNLQYDDCAAELDEAERRFGVPIHRWPDLDLKDDFEGTAALTANLDLVIAPAVSSAELAGALGGPVWRFGHRDWTQLGTGVRPWYPSMRLFGPRAGESMGDVLARMAIEITRFAPA